MNAPVKIVGFTVGLIAAFGAAFGLGRVVGPFDSGHGGSGHEMPVTTTTMDHGGHS